MDITHDPKSIQLTSAEIAYLWSTYVMNCKGKYVASYFIEKLDDVDMRFVMQSAFDLTCRSIDETEKIFNTVNFPIPYGFKEKDVNLKADKLFSDILMFYILKYDTMLGLTNYGIAMTLSARSDVKNFFTDTLFATIDLSNKIDKVVLEKGIYFRTPNIPIPDDVKFTDKQGFLGSFIGESRPLNAMEITHIFNTSITNCIGSAQTLGLIQVVVNSRIKKFLMKCNKVFNEQIKNLNEILLKENLNTPMLLDSQIIKATESPFSERLLMFFTIATINDILNSYAETLVLTMRKDVTLSLTKLSGQIMLLLKNGVDILLDKSWVEEIPENTDR